VVRDGHVSARVSGRADSAEMVQYYDGCYPRSVAVAYAAVRGAGMALFSIEPARLAR